MLPFLTSQRQRCSERIELLIEAPNASPSTHLDLIFYEGKLIHTLDPDTCKEGVQAVVAIGDETWPGFFHAVVIQLDAPRLLRGGELTDLGNVYILHGFSIETRE